MRSAGAGTFARHAPPCRALNAVLLAAGYGTRIRPLFPNTPKALIEVGGRALIDHLLANLARSGVVESALVVISDGTASEEERFGALGDLQLALRLVDRDGDVLVAATDKLLAFELAEPLRFARERAAPVTLRVRMPDRRRLAGRHGCVLLDAAGRIVDFLTEGGAYDVGTPESYAEAQRAFRTMQDGSPG